jgi:hypothetical protein
MTTQSASRDPRFVSITEHARAEAGPGALQVAKIDVKPGATLHVAGRPYTIGPIRRADGAFAIRDRHDDLRGNVSAFELLRRTGALPADCEIDDLCLRNPRNGDCMIELCHDGPPLGDVDPLVQPVKRHVFVRFDAAMQNPHLDGATFDEIIVRGSSCMF